MIDALLCNGTTLVVGAAGGIGAGIVRRLAAENVPLALADTDGPQLEQLGEVASDRPVFTMHVDVTSADSVEQLVAAVESELGPIGYFVQAAGIQRLGPLVSFSDADFDATFAVNTRGMFLCVRAVATRMLARRMGSIVAIASNAARVPRVKQGAYCASKAAVAHLIRAFALELSPYGIRVNSVSPGATETPMIRRMMAEMKFEQDLLRGNLENFRVGTPLGKNASIEDIAEAVVFLLSERAGHITMYDLVVDGGASLGA